MAYSFCHDTEPCSDIKKSLRASRSALHWAGFVALPTLPVPGSMLVRHVLERGGGCAGGDEVYCFGAFLSKKLCKYSVAKTTCSTFLGSNLMALWYISNLQNNNNLLNVMIFKNT